LNGSFVRLSELYSEIFRDDVASSTTDDEDAFRVTADRHRSREANICAEGWHDETCASRTPDVGTLNALAEARHAARKRDTFSFMLPGLLLQMAGLRLRLQPVVLRLRLQPE